MIKLPIEIGDTILVGRFKNKKVQVKEIGTDDHGSPTINGRSILNIRMTKEKMKESKLNEGVRKVLDFDSASDKEEAEEFLDKNRVKSKTVKGKYGPVLQVDFKNEIEAASKISHMKKKLNIKFGEVKESKMKESELRQIIKEEIQKVFENSKERSLWKKAEREFDSNNITVAAHYIAVASGRKGIGDISPKSAKEIDKLSKENPSRSEFLIGVARIIKKHG